MGPTRFEVIMDDGGLDLIEVAQGADDLHDNGACLLLRHQLVLLQVEVQVVAFTELQDSTEPAEMEAHRRAVDCKQVKGNETILSLIY